MIVADIMSFMTPNQLVLYSTPFIRKVLELCLVFQIFALSLMLSVEPGECIMT